MLAVTLKPGERVLVGENIKITYKKRGSKMMLLFDAPREVSIVREKVLEKHGLSIDNTMIKGE
jgi:sRNA-binding carbon storage regulator CsrA